MHKNEESDSHAQSKYFFASRSRSETSALLLHVVLPQFNKMVESDLLHSLVFLSSSNYSCVKRVCLRIRRLEQLMVQNPRVIVLLPFDR